MPSIQQKLEGSNIKALYKLFDNQVKLMGATGIITRYKITVNKYEDDEDVLLISQDNITLIIDYPTTDIPINRLRNDISDDLNDNTGIYLFDVLPISAYTKFSDNVSKGDILVQKLLDENSNEIKLVFRVSEVFGGFGTRGLIYHKLYIAPYNQGYEYFDQNVINAINEL